MVVDLKKMQKELASLKSSKKEKDSYSIKSKVISKSVLSKNKMSVHIPDKEYESTWDDENRFFKGELNKEKRALFFS